MRYAIIFLGLFVSWFVKAENLPPAVHATVKVTVGEKVSRFSIEKTSGGAQPDQLVYSSNLDKPRVFMLNSKNRDYLLRKIASIQPPYSDVSSCPRSAIELTAGAKSLTGCLKGKKKSDDEIRALLRLMSTVI